MWIDQHGRSKQKLRVSLTDRCNFRCQYCLPETPKWLESSALLSVDELYKLVTIFVDNGISSLRLTGGEPLLRPDVVECVKAFNRLRSQGLKRISMTTNASRLATKIAALKDAGLDDLNISIDAINPAQFLALTKSDLAPVLEGIDAAVAINMPVKLNCVLMRGVNDEQILPLTEWAGMRGLTLRFIEYMPLDSAQKWSDKKVVNEDEVLSVLASRYQLQALTRGSDPASEYLLNGTQKIGFISTVSKPFCAQCNRLRLTSTGALYSCLFGKQGAPLGQFLRAGASVHELAQKIEQAVWNKPEGYITLKNLVERPITMHTLGG